MFPKNSSHMKPLPLHPPNRIGVWMARGMRQGSPNTRRRESSKQRRRLACNTSGYWQAAICLRLFRRAVHTGSNPHDRRLRNPVRKYGMKRHHQDRPMNPYAPPTEKPERRPPHRWCYRASAMRGHALVCESSVRQHVTQCTDVSDHLNCVQPQG